MVILANKTLQAIEDALNGDKCGQFRQNLAWLLPKMEDAYRGTEKPYRKHLGASGIGAECSREIQLKWRWTSVPTFEERMLRLFNRGHLEEARFLAMLLCVPGLQLWFETEDGGQYKWSDHAGHYGSALDGIALGVPDLEPNTPAYTEFKTAGSKSFAKIKKNGVRAEKWEHFVQMQQCMKYYKLPASLYMVVNKDNDELYAEIINYEPHYADQYSRRAKEIIYTTDTLPRISNNKTFYKCRFCDKKAICHGDVIPDINCRTCAHWSAETDGGFSCARSNTEVHSDESFNGCPEHVYDPTLIPALSYIGGNSEQNYAEYATRDGELIKQGPAFMGSLEFKERFTKDK